MQKILKNDKIFLDKYNTFLLILLIMVLSGIFGYIYEILFYRIDLGYWVNRGATIGPWLPIYAFGGLLISFSTYKFKNNPLLVFIISCLVCGLLEFLTGFLLFNINGVRLWDYNIEIWNFGNIGGFICLRSVVFFGLSGLFLIYSLIPILKLISTKFNKILFSVLSITLSLLFLIDFIFHYLIKL